MGRKDDITLAKGALSVTLFTVQDTENYKNIVKVIPGVVTPDNQGSGVKLPSVVDLLRITHTLQFECYIMETNSLSALTVKNNLKTIFNGANVASAPVVLTYEDSSVDVWIEDMVIKGINDDNSITSGGYSGEDAAQYHVTLTLVEGKLVGT